MADVNMDKDLPAAYDFVTYQLPLYLGQVWGLLDAGNVSMAKMVVQHLVNDLLPKLGGHQCAPVQPVRLFRPHRGQLDDAMREVTTVSSRLELARHIVANKHVDERWIASKLKTIPKGPELMPADFDAVHLVLKLMAVTPYEDDPRIGWDTYIVTLEEWGPVGFTNGPLP